MSLFSRLRLGARLVLELTGILLALTGCARTPPPDQDDADAVAVLVGSIQHQIGLYPQLRGRPLDVMTEDEQDRFRISLQYVRARHWALTQHLQKIDRSSRRGKELAAFLERWPDEARLEAGLLESPQQSSKAGGLDADLKSLARHFPQNTRKSLIRIYRP